MGKLVDSMRQWISSSRDESQSGDGSGKERQPSEAEERQEFKSLRIQPTPNPHACQFIINEPVVNSGFIGFNSAEEAKGDAFAEAVFEVFGVEGVFLKENFVTITKSPVVGWDPLVTEIESVIESHLAFYENPASPQAPVAEASHSEAKELDLGEFLNFSDEEKMKIINAVLDQAIRPALANDGGDLVLLGMTGNVVQIHYQGACGTCPSAAMGTLKYIETLL
ncbi:MAG: NifU family protein, partial [Nitrospinales bacterium]